MSVKARALLILSCVLVGTIGWAFAPSSYDDGYITYRYADNLANGRGFAFNPGEVVFGTSAPGYAGTLAAFAWLLAPLHVGVDSIGATLFLLSFAGLPLLLCGVLRRLGVALPEISAAAFALLAIPAQWNVEMMGCEQVPILALVAAACLLVLDGRDFAAGLFAGLAGAFRFDAGLAVGALAIALIVERRRVPWRLLLGSSAPVLLCWGWLIVTFGTIIPATLAGKKSEFHLVSRSYGGEEVQWLVRTLGIPGALALAVLATWGLVSIARSTARARTYFASALGWVVLHEAFYRAVDIPFAPWYQIVTVNSLFVLGGIAVAGAANGIRALGAPVIARSAAAGILMGVIALSSAAFVAKTWGRPPDPRIRIYRDVADVFRNGAPAGASIASVEVGALAYFSNRRIVDLAGLLDERIRAAARAKELVPYLERDPPDYFLDNSTFHSNFLAQVVSSDFLSGYASVREFSRPEYPHPIRLLRRQNATRQ